MAYRNKVFVSFDGDNDIQYYRLMLAWKQSDHTSFNFTNAHDLNTARDTSTEETIKRKLRERLINSKIFISLIGENTRYLYKFVRWEIEQAISLNIPIIAVNLNGNRHLDTLRCPPILKEQTAIHTSFNSKIIEYALSNWDNQYRNLEQKSNTGPFYYNNSVYTRLGL